MYALTEKVTQATDEILEKLESLAKYNNLWWELPRRTQEPNKEEILLEWYHCTKKYCLYIYEDSGEVQHIDYFALSGNDYTDINSKTLDLKKENSLLDFWKWIAE
jgi:hypothetical protein